MYMFVNRSGKPIDTLKKIFSTYDVNKDGKLDPEEVKGLLKVSTTFVCIKCSKIMYSTNVFRLLLCIQLMYSDFYYVFN